MAATAVDVGIDVSQDALDIATTDQETWHIPYQPRPLAALVRRLRKLQPARIIVESTGRVQDALVIALLEAGLPVVVVNPRQVRDFGKATGHLAKTDRLDAALLARFGQALRPPVRTLPDEATRALAALVVRRRQVQSMIVAEQHRLGRAPQGVQCEIREHLAYLAGRRDGLDQELATALRQSPVFAAREALLRSVPGIGPTTTATLIAELPELGHATKKEIAALGGLAPFAHDSGRLKGRRVTRGGRGEVRKTFFMATLVATRCNPLIRAHYQHLLAQGKPKKVALIACARKLLVILNAMLQTATPWNPALCPQP